MKKIKLYNGLLIGKFSDPQKGNFRVEFHAYVGAYSVRHAVEMINQKSCELFMNVTINYVSKYWNKCWGDSMNGIEPQIGLWIRKNNIYNNNIPVKRII